MRGFLKIFLACFLALFLFTLVVIFSGVGFISGLADSDRPVVKDKTVLVFDMSKPVMDQTIESGFAFPAGLQQSVLGVYDMASAIDKASEDKNVEGIMLTGNYSRGGFATNEELRSALVRFRKKGKWIVANNDFLSQRSYELASTADSIYMSPAGGMDWQGYSYQFLFFKDALDRLNIKPEIFYAGKFKSATEPFRLTKMSDANRLQLSNFLEDLYQNFLIQTAQARKTDTATLRQLAQNLALSSTHDALQANLVDVAGYDDEARLYVTRKLGLKPDSRANYMSLQDYVEAAKDDQPETSDKVALIFAQGEIIDGRANENVISGEKMRTLIRKLRLDRRVKAVVLRVNSPGGSALASETIHHELELLKKDKPLVVSMGDYAASGGYYIACNADSIFTNHTTLTGSIGVFAVLFDASKFMQSKLGVTVDEVSTARSASLGSPFRPMNDTERKYFQDGIDSTYQMFLRRVAVGRKMQVAQVDSIGQGRIWSGTDAVKLGLADKIGNLNDAIACAARMAKLDKYRVRQYPEQQSFVEKIMKGDDEEEVNMQMTSAVIEQKMGSDFIALWKQVNLLKQMSGKVQMRLPFFVQ